MQGMGSEYILAFISLLAILIGILVVYFLLKSQTSYVDAYKK